MVQQIHVLHRVLLVLLDYKLTAHVNRVYGVLLMIISGVGVETVDSMRKVVMRK